MIEVFKTNVSEPELASRIIEGIHSNFEYLEANFDLNDCDRILRVRWTSGNVQPDFLMNFLKNHGCNAEVLEG